MVGTLGNSAADALVGFAIHKNILLLIGFKASMTHPHKFMRRFYGKYCIWNEFMIFYRKPNKRRIPMAKIAPSILSADFANLERDIHNIEENGSDWVHVDVMDGIFVPNISIGIPVVKALRPVTDLPLDVHLMIDRPIRYVEEFVKAGADYVTIHIEADQPQNTLEALDKIHALGCKAGIVLKPKTPVEAAIPYLEKCDLVLVMTVEPGFGGQKFMADMMPKIRQLRDWLDDINPDCLVEVDGGVDAVTCETCKEHGADVLVAGSAYFKAVNRAEFVKLIQK
jgi:ribulose-phosphate 3-epimerase